jgi:hypothetical protein
VTLIAQNDWDALNAYSDGELPDADVVKLEARLCADPTLQEALDQIRGIGLALKPLRPEVGLAPERSQNSRSSYRHLAIAASIVLVFAFGGYSFLKPAPGFSPTDLHQAYLQQPFDVAQDGLQQVISRTDLPNLAGANLTLVADVTERNAIRALHYAGRNGCRLTLTIAGGGAPDIKAASDLLLASWEVNSVHYTLLATGMDSNRFAAIADFVRDHYEQQAQQATIMAMRDATETAVPCKTA